MIDFKITGLYVEIVAGSYRTDAFKKMLELSKMTKLPICFRFNETYFVATPNQTYDEFLKEYGE